MLAIMLNTSGLLLASIFLFKKPGIAEAFEKFEAYVNWKARRWEQKDV